MAFDSARYYRHDEIAALLAAWADAHPELVTVEEIGRSHEGRPLFVATLTLLATGPAREKSAYWIDANIHAEELAGSTAALHTIASLLDGYGRDPLATEVLEKHAVYVCPRVSPDGAERCLTGRAGKLRSSLRPYPLEDALPGLHPADIDADGEILQMRVRDDDGPWRQSPRDPRLLLRRRPGDRLGPFFRLYVEGLVRDAAGGLAGATPDPRVPPTPFGLDLNRNFPFEWAREGEGGLSGTGPFPLSEPETRAVAAFVSEHPNIVGATTYHTFSGVLLRPYSTRPDEAMPRSDLARYEAIGALGNRLTGYPCRSVFHGFRSAHDPLTRGAFDDWCYEHLGVFAFTTELWSIGTAAGLTVDDYYGFFKARSEDDELAILAWNDRVLDGAGFSPWRPFAHPQLGPVEIGGWRTLYTWSNPPPRLLPEVVAPQCRFTLEQAALGPRLELKLEEAIVGVAEGGGALRKLTATVENRGWLPTGVVANPPAGERARGITLTLATDAELVVGQRRVDVGQLEGISHLDELRVAEPAYFGGSDRVRAATVEWLLCGAGAVTVEAFGPRSGTVRRTIGG